MFDITPVVPEARLIVKRAAQVYLQHTEPWCIGILIHGSGGRLHPELQRHRPTTIPAAFRLRFKRPVAT